MNDLLVGNAHCSWGTLPRESYEELRPGRLEEVAE